MESLGQISRTQGTGGRHWWLLTRSTPDTLLWIFRFFSCVLHQWSWVTVLHHHCSSEVNFLWERNSHLVSFWISRETDDVHCYCQICITTACQRITFSENETHISSLFELIWRQVIYMVISQWAWGSRRASSLRLKEFFSKMLLEESSTLFLEIPRILLSESSMLLLEVENSLSGYPGGYPVGYPVDCSSRWTEFSSRKALKRCSLKLKEFLSQKSSTQTHWDSLEESNTAPRVPQNSFLGELRNATPWD